MKYIEDILDFFKKKKSISNELVIKSIRNILKDKKFIDELNFRRNIFDIMRWQFIEKVKDQEIKSSVEVMFDSGQYTMKLSKQQTKIVKISVFGFYDENMDHVIKKNKILKFTSKNDLKDLIVINTLIDDISDDIIKSRDFFNDYTEDDINDYLVDLKDVLSSEIQLERDYKNSAWEITFDCDKINLDEVLREIKELSNLLKNINLKLTNKYQENTHIDNYEFCFLISI